MLPDMVATVIETLGPAWPELVTQRELITRVAAAEEDSFGRTLRTGMGMLSTAIEETRQRGEQQLSGSTAFKLHDTYGFPVELTLEIAEEDERRRRRRRGRALGGSRWHWRIGRRAAGNDTRGGGRIDHDGRLITGTRNSEGL